jgi:integrase
MTARGLGRVFLRGSTWWIRMSVNGHEIRKSSGSPDKAVAERKLKTEWKLVGAGRHVEPKAERTTVAALLDGLALDYRNNGRRSNLEPRTRPLRTAFGHWRAVDVTPAAVEKYKAARLLEKTIRGTLVAKGTVNRELAALKRAFTIGQEQGRISFKPLIKVFPEAAARKGFTDPGTFEVIVKHLPEPLNDAARFAYGSGWRLEEVLGVEWPHVDRGAGTVTLEPERSKTEEARVLPLVGELAELIERRWKARATSPYVFHHHGGRRYRNIRASWAKATEAAGVAGLKFHDLRRSAVRNMILAGVSEKVAMTITGHKTRAVFDRYHIVTTADARAALEKTQAAVKAAPRAKVTKLRGRK